MRLSAGFVTFVLLLGYSVAQERQGGVINMRGDRSASAPQLGLPVHHSGMVVQVDLTRVAILVRMKRGEEMGFAIDAKCQIKADKKQFGKKKLLLSELQPGSLVDLTIRQSDMNVIEIKAKKPPTQPPPGN